MAHTILTMYDVLVDVQFKIIYRFLVRFQVFLFDGKNKDTYISRYYRDMYGHVSNTTMILLSG